jgi:glycosyltransferase involved in cell wall biosynthesis
MRVAIVTINFPTGDLIGGAELQAYFLAKHLPCLGATTTYIAMRNHDGEAYVAEREGFLLRVLSGRHERMWRAMMRLFKCFREERPDVCYVREFRILFPLFILCRVAGVPIVFNTTHEKNLFPYYGWQGVKGTFFHFLSFLTLRFVDHVVTNNTTHATLLKERYRLKATPILNSMEDHYVSGTAKQKRVLWVANVKSRKRPEVFIRLADALRDTGYEFVMVGHLYGETGKYHDLIAQAQKENSVFRFLGGKTPREVDALLASSEIFVSTCKPEGFPNNIIQACLAECAIVSFDYDPDGIFWRNHIGFVPATFDDTIALMWKLVANEEMRREAGERARAYAIAHHSLDRNMKTFYQLFKNV